jgi:Phosphoketolase
MAAALISAPPCLQEGGVEWFIKHLELHGFEPLVFDGRDPAAFAWAIWEQERRLRAYAASLDSVEHYHVPIPYGIAVAPKGAGFYNEGTNYAHNLPLVDNPHVNEVAAKRFTTHVKKLYVPLEDLQRCVGLFHNHKMQVVLKKESSGCQPQCQFKTLPICLSDITRSV